MSPYSPSKPLAEPQNRVALRASRRCHDHRDGNPAEDIPHGGTDKYHADAGKQNPPRADVEYRRKHLTVTAEQVELDRHTAQQVDGAHNQRNDPGTPSVPPAG